MAIPLEDLSQDIVGKAQRGLGLSDEALGRSAGIAAADVLRLKQGDVLPEALQQVAGPLKLGARALLDSARKAWAPKPVEVPGLACFTTPYQDMTVNAYLVWDETSRRAAVFDTGADASPILDCLQSNRLQLEAIFITHAHGDHIFDLDRLAEKTGAPAWIGSREEFSGPKPFEAGRSFSVGALTIGTRLTWGHAKGGITYVVDGLARRVAVVGDAIFAGSMGGGAVSYRDALETNRSQILTLPEDTVLCPGHGPMTTVGEEKRHNPFFPEFQPDTTN